MKKTKQIIKSDKFILVSDIIERFPFEEINEYMEETNWTWAIPYKKKGKVPSIKELEDTAIELLYEAKYNNYPQLDEFYITTGGLTAYKDNRTQEIWLTFTL